MKLTLAATLIVCLPASSPTGKAPLRLAPAYSASSLVNSASNEPGPIAPNTIVSLYGTELAWGTRALDGGDLQGSSLPLVLPGSGVRIAVNSIGAHIYFVSTRQINLLIPSSLKEGAAMLQLTLDGRAGPIIRFPLAAAAPALYLQADKIAIATSPSGSLYTLQSPASPGDWVILYATGLGLTKPAAAYGEISRRAAPLAQTDDFHVLLNGASLEAARVGYVGLAPGFAGLYQINLHLPDATAPNPEIRIVMSSATSPASVILPVAQALKPVASQSSGRPKPGHAQSRLMNK